MTRSRAIKIIDRRRMFLQNRIDEQRRVGRNPSFDCSERKALELAMTALVQTKGDPDDSFRGPGIRKRSTEEVL